MACKNVCRAFFLHAIEITLTRCPLPRPATCPLQVLGNLAYVYLSVAFIQMLKAGMPLLVLGFLWPAQPLTSSAIPLHPPLPSVAVSIETTRGSAGEMVELSPVAQARRRGAPGAGRAAGGLRHRGRHRRRVLWRAAALVDRARCDVRPSQLQSLWTVPTAAVSYDKDVSTQSHDSYAQMHKAYAKGLCIRVHIPYG